MERNFSDLATLLARGISHCRMYFVGHPNVEAAAQEFKTHIGPLLKQGQLDVFLLGISDGKLIHEGKYLVGPTIVGSRLTRFAALLQTGGFVFRTEVSAQELKTFFVLASEVTKPQADLDASQRMFEQRGITNITLKGPYHEENILANEENELLLRNGIAELIPVYRSLFDTVEQAHQNVGLDRALDMSSAQTAGESLVKASTSHLTDIMTLVDYPDFDSYTVGHSVRVAMLAVLVGREAGLEDATLAEVASASLLHDVGKGKIPPEVLFKPGKLAKEERKIIETHPAIGAAMLLESRDAGSLAVATAWGHHRRYDGGGYPRMPYASHVSELTQLVHICDVFEALTAIRPYKKALTPRDAYEIILRDSGAYSPLAVTALRRAVGLYPPGSRVVLSTGHQAVVTAAGPHMELPRVRITHDTSGAEIPAASQPDVDLSDADAATTVVRMLIGA